MPRLSAYEEAFDEDDEEEIGDTEEGDIIARSQASHRLYEDGSFPAKRSSLYRYGGVGRTCLTHYYLRPLEVTDMSLGSRLCGLSRSKCCHSIADNNTDQ